MLQKLATSGHHISTAEMYLGRELTQEERAEYIQNLLLGSISRREAMTPAQCEGLAQEAINSIQLTGESGVMIPVQDGQGNISFQALHQNTE